MLTLPSGKLHEILLVNNTKDRMIKLFILRSDVEERKMLQPIFSFLFLYHGGRGSRRSTEKISVYHCVFVPLWFIFLIPSYDFLKILLPCFDGGCSKFHYFINKLQIMFRWFAGLCVIDSKCSQQFFVNTKYRSGPA